MDDYIAKPIRARQLYEAVERVGERAGSHVERAFAGAEAGRTEVPDAPAVDWEAAGAALGSGTAGVSLAELAGVFVEEGPRLLEDLRTALFGDDDPVELTVVRRLAHTFKGTLRVFCAGPAARAAERLEAAARSDDVTASREAFARFESELERVLSAARAESSDGPDRR